MKKLFRAFTVLAFVFVFSFSSFAGLLDGLISDSISNLTDIDKLTEGIETYKDDSWLDKLLNKVGVELPSEKAKKKIISDGLTPMSESEYKEYKANKSSTKFSNETDKVDKDTQEILDNVNTMFDGISKGIGNPYKIKVDENGVDTEEFAKGVVENEVKNAVTDIEDSVLSVVPGYDTYKDIKSIEGAANKINDNINSINETKESQSIKEKAKIAFPKGSTIAKETIQTLKDEGLTVSTEGSGDTYEIVGYGSVNGKDAVRVKAIKKESETTSQDSNSFKTGLEELDKALDIAVTDKDKFNNVMDIFGTSDDKLKLGEDLMSGNYGAILDDMGMGGLSNIPGLEALGEFDNSRKLTVGEMYEPIQGEALEGVKEKVSEFIKDKTLDDFKKELNSLYSKDYELIAGVDINTCKSLEDYIMKVTEFTTSAYFLIIKRYYNLTEDDFDYSTVVVKELNALQPKYLEIPKYDEIFKILDSWVKDSAKSKLIDVTKEVNAVKSNKNIAKMNQMYEQDLVTYKFEDIPFYILVQLYDIHPVSINNDDSNYNGHLWVSKNDINRLKDNPNKYLYDNNITLNDILNNKEDYNFLTFYLYTNDPICKTDNDSSYNGQYSKKLNSTDSITIRKSLYKELSKLKTVTGSTSDNKSILFKDASLLQIAQYMNSNNEKYLKLEDCYKVPSIVNGIYGYANSLRNYSESGLMSFEEIIQKELEKEKKYQSRMEEPITTVKIKNILNNGYDYFKDSCIYWNDLILSSLDSEYLKNYSFIDINSPIIVSDIRDDDGNIVNPKQAKVSKIKLKDASLEQYLTSEVYIYYKTIPKLKFFNTIKEQYNNFKKGKNPPKDDSIMGINYNKHTNEIKLYKLTRTNTKIASENDEINVYNLVPLDKNDIKKNQDVFNNQVNAVSKMIGKTYTVDEFKKINKEYSSILFYYKDGDTSKHVTNYNLGDKFNWASKVKIKDKSKSEGSFIVELIK